MNTQSIILLSALLMFGAACFAQKQTQQVGQAWLAYANQTRLTNKFGLWGDFHLRTRENVVEDVSTTIVRLGLTYYASEKVRLTAGYAWVNAFPSGAVTVTQPEHRPWQQIQWTSNSPRLRIMQWLRFEERFRRKIDANTSLADGYNFNYRLRYNFLITIPLGERAFQKKALSLVFNDEVHVNFGKEIVYNYFDQNRFFAGFSYHLNAADNIQFGYMNLFQQLAAGNRYRTIHAPRIFYFHNLDLRKKK